MNGFTRLLAAWTAAVLLLWPLAVMAEETSHGRPIEGPPSPAMIGGWDYGNMRWTVAVDQNGNMRIVSADAADWRTENIAIDQWVGDQYTSGWIDARQLGAFKMIGVKTAGGSGSAMYVGVEGSYSATPDTNSAFIIPVGNSKPALSSGFASLGRFRTCSAVDGDSTTARISNAFAVSDSATGTPAVFPYYRIQVWVTGGAKKLFAYMVGRRL